MWGGPQRQTRDVPCPDRDRRGSSPDQPAPRWAFFVQQPSHLVFQAGCERVFAPETSTSSVIHANARPSKPAEPCLQNLVFSSGSVTPFVEPGAACCPPSDASEGPARAWRVLQATRNERPPSRPPKRGPDVAPSSIALLFITTMVKELPHRPQPNRLPSDRLPPPKQAKMRRSRFQIARSFPSVRSSPRKKQRSWPLPVLAPPLGVG